ncbi:MAG TPA: PAS domain S-box protein [Candidatus Paceibacterota bacterium]|nr:PAS domain S-box protein [Candidatus Paceibacterota bacterium]
MQAQKVIERLGYTQNEAKVYLAALALGEAHVSDIALRAKLPRTSVQSIVEKLHKDGLMNFYVQRRYKYWVAEDPKRFLASLRNREEALREAMPALSKMRNSQRKKNVPAKVDADATLDVFRLLAESVQQPVLITNELMEIAYVNRSWERLFGYGLHEVRGKHPRMLQSGRTSRTAYDRLRETLLAGKLYQSDEFVDRKKDGSTFHLLTTIFPVSRNGRQYFIQILDDTTERERIDALRTEFTRAFFARK